MLATFLDLTRFLERIGIQHTVARGVLRLQLDGTPLAALWDPQARRVYARLDVDVAWRTPWVFLELGADARISESAMVGLLQAVATRRW